MWHRQGCSKALLEVMTLNSFLTSSSGDLVLPKGFASSFFKFTARRTETLWYAPFFSLVFYLMGIIRDATKAIGRLNNNLEWACIDHWVFRLFRLRIWFYAACRRRKPFLWMLDKMVHRQTHVNSSSGTWLRYLGDSIALNRRLNRIPKLLMRSGK